MTNKQQDDNDKKPEPTVAEIIGGLQIPARGGRMLKTYVELPDGTWLKVRISRRLSAPVQ